MDRLRLFLTVLTMSIVRVELLEAHRIDAHTHIVPSFYLEWLVEQGFESLAASQPAWNASMHLDFMESAGIKTSVVSITTPGVGPLNRSSDSRMSPTQEEARVMARKLNEYCAMELARKYPGKFQCWATMTLPDVNGSIVEAIHALRNLKAAGVFLESNKLGIYLGDSEFEPFFQTLNELQALLFVHPTYLPNVIEVPGIGQSVVDFTLDLTRAAVNLVFTNTTQKYPNITYIFASGGGSLPFVAYRVALGSKYYSSSLMIDEFKKFYYDTAFASSPSAMPTFLEFATAGRMVFGTDWPQGVNSGSSFYTQTLDSYSLSQEDRDKINSSNIENIWNQLSFSSRH